MSSGDEIQAVPEGQQEGRDASQENQETSEQSRRVEQAAIEPEAVVERERDVQQSEEIEAELVQAIEAVTEDGGRGTEDREGQAAGTEQVSATPIPLPTDPPTIREEISATPIPLPGENQEGPEDRISATPIPLPRPSGETQVNEISATPIPLPRPSGETQVNEISATPIPLPGGNQEGPEDRISATPIPLPRPSDETQVDEISAMPIPLPRPSDETQVDEISAMPIPLPRPSDEAQVNEISAMPIPLPRPSGETQGNEISATPINTPGQNDEVELISENDRISLVSDKTRAAETAPSPEIEKEPPPPPPPPDLEVKQEKSADEPRQVIAGAPVEEILSGAGPERGEIRTESDAEMSKDPPPPPPDLEMTQEKPAEQLRQESETRTAESRVPNSAEELDLDGKGGSLSGEDRSSAPDSEVELDGKGGSPPTSEFETQAHSATEAAAEEPGVFTTSGEEALLETEDPGISEMLDTEAEATKEVEEYWEPPEMYVYTAEDGSITLVDAEGNPIKCPPQYFFDKGVSNTFKAWYPGGKNVQAFDVPPFPGYKADEFYVKAGPENTYLVVDRDGNPLQNQPELWHNDLIEGFFIEDQDSNVVELKVYNEIYIYTSQDGTKTLVDSSGNPLKCPPKVSGHADTGYFIKGPNGEQIQVKDYSSPTTDIYVYTAPDGTKTVVDSSGNPIKCPPKISGGHADDLGYFIKGAEGEKIEVKDYSPPTTDIYVYTAQDGTKTVVDSAGNPIKCPPSISGHADAGYFIKGAEGEKIEVKDYSSPITDIYVYTAQDGTKTVVDQYGDPVKSPPPVWNDPTGNGAVTVGPEGEKIKLKEYKPISSHWKK